MINNVLTYIFIGVVFNLLFDLVVHYVGDEENRFTMGERAVTALLWPIAVLVFLYNFIKTLSR